MKNIQNGLLRVPEITLIFWIIKVLSTTVGETGADFLAEDLGLGMPLVAGIMSFIMAVLLIFQFTKFKKYIPWNYWSIVILMSIIGTLITDILVDDIGISLLTLSIVFTISMIAVFIVWFKEEKTLSIHSINTGVREIYYWIIILMAFALGTGVGDLISEYFELGYGIALLLFGGAIALIAFSVFVLKLDRTLGFWLAFILTRPLGASLGDFFTQPLENGGIDINIGIVNAVFFTAIVSMVIYLSAKEKIKEKEHGTNF
ncbi:MAG: hypothetical protein PHF33_01435 [Candidatus Delongbacteria bacterium]|nr:hypothetical protein [Candidatus Delongbacteria bacterium]MDD4204490.1 hypothetical protein [Candidatus Delongbacteria bacterium]